MEIELSPEQPDPVEAAVAGLVEGAAEPDPWWQAGLEAALEE